MEIKKPHLEASMATKTTQTGRTDTAPKVSDSEVRLARALARSYERDHQEPDQQILAIAALPLPEDQIPA